MLEYQPLIYMPINFTIFAIIAIYGDYIMENKNIQQLIETHYDNDIRGKITRSAETNL